MPGRRVSGFSVSWGMAVCLILIQLRLPGSARSSGFDVDMVLEMRLNVREGRGEMLPPCSPPATKYQCKCMSQIVLNVPWLGSGKGNNWILGWGQDQVINVRWMMSFQCMDKWMVWSAYGGQFFTDWRTGWIGWDWIGCLFGRDRCSPEIIPELDWLMIQKCCSHVIKQQQNRFFKDYQGNVVLLSFQSSD